MLLTRFNAFSRATIAPQLPNVQRNSTIVPNINVAEKVFTLFRNNPTDVSAYFKTRENLIHFQFWIAENERVDLHGFKTVPARELLFCATPWVEVPCLLFGSSKKKFFLYIVPDETQEPTADIETVLLEWALLKRKRIFWLLFQKSPHRLERGGWDLQTIKIDLIFINVPYNASHNWTSNVWKWLVH